MASLHWSLNFFNFFVVNWQFVKFSLRIQERREKDLLLFFCSIEDKALPRNINRIFARIAQVRTIAIHVYAF